MLNVVLTTFHVLVAVFLVLVVLLQTGKRADLAGAFGGGGSQTAFGTRGAATLLSKLTTGAAVLFMITSLGLSLFTSRSVGGADDTVLGDLPAAEAAETPAATPPPAAPMEPERSSSPAADVEPEEGRSP